MARRRTKKDDMITPVPTPERQLDHSSGWCITGDHKQCRFSFNHGKCGCSCHKGAKTIVKKEKPEEEVAPTPKRRGRPPKDSVQRTDSVTTTGPNDPRPWK